MIRSYFYFLPCVTHHSRHKQFRHFSLGWRSLTFKAHVNFTLRSSFRKTKSPSLAEDSLFWKKIRYSQALAHVNMQALLAALCCYDWDRGNLTSVRPSLLKCEITARWPLWRCPHPHCFVSNVCSFIINKIIAPQTLSAILCSCNSPLQPIAPANPIARPFDYIQQSQPLTASNLHTPFAHSFSRALLTPEL